jgi:hypothetical protein
VPRPRPGARGNGIIGGRKDEGLLGEDGEDGGVTGSDGTEQVAGGGIANGVVAIDVEELTGRAVEAGHLKVVRTISSDHEAVFKSFALFLERHGANYRARIPGEHEADAELSGHRPAYPRRS